MLILGLGYIIIMFKFFNNKFNIKFINIRFNNIKFNI